MAPSPSPADLVSPLRVMSFNIRYANVTDGEDAWDKRKDFLVRTVEKYDPHLLGLQEVVAEQSDFMKAALPGYELIGGGRDDGQRKGEASTILVRKSRFEVLEFGQFWLSPTPNVVGSRGWDAALPRVCTFARMKDKAAEKTLVYWNTHWDHQGNTARIESAKLMRGKLADMAGDNPVIVTGDFNSYETMEAYSILLGNSTESVKLLDCYREIHPERKPDEASFHAFTGNVDGMRIDWILHSRQLTALGAAIDHTSENGRYPSDHFPVTAELRYE